MSVGGGTIASASDNDGRLPDGTPIPTQAIEDPASYSQPGEIGLGVPTVSGDKIAQIGSGGLGTQASQLVAASGGRAVAVVSGDDRGEYAMKYGAIGYLDRRAYDYWGIPPLVDDKEGQKAWTASARLRQGSLVRRGRAGGPGHRVRAPGRGDDPDQHLPVPPGGMVVICAGTTGFDAMVDLRYHWTRQKRLQGSHGTNDAQAYAYNDLVRDQKVDPVVGRVLPFTDVPRAHAEMGRGEEVFGNTVILVGADDPESGRR